MTDIEFQQLLTTCQSLMSEQKAELIKVLLGDSTIKVGFPNQEENIVSTNSIPTAIKILAESLRNRRGGRLRFEFYPERKSA